MTIIKTIGIAGVAVSALILSLPLIAADQSGMGANSGRGTLKGGSEYEQQMRQSGMEGMSGMAGEHSMTAKPAKPAKAAKKTAAKKAGDGSKAAAQPTKQ